jgi:zona occludens toxin (predicted ATPase)
MNINEGKSIVDNLQGLTLSKSVIDYYKKLADAIIEEWNTPVDVNVKGAINRKDLLTKHKKIGPLVSS